MIKFQGLRASDVSWTNFFEDLQRKKIKMKVKRRNNLAQCLKNRNCVRGKEAKTDLRTKNFAYCSKDFYVVATL